MTGLVHAIGVGVAGGAALVTDTDNISGNSFF